MSDEPQVSVIIPTYNRSDFLRIAIASALSQTFQSLEIIVIDDASENDVKKVTTQFGDGRLRLVRHRTNRGVAAARNTGVANAQGKYIAFLDDDDEWLPDKIERQFELLERSPKSVGVVYTGWVAVDAASGRVLYRVTPNERGDIFESMLLQDSLAPTSSLFLKKECFEKVGLFDVEFAYGEDFDMWLRIAQEYQFDFVKESLVRYSIPLGKASLSMNYEQIIKSAEAQIRKHAAFFALHRRILGGRYLSLGVLHCYNGDVRKGRAAFYNGIRTYPFEMRHYFNLFLSFLGSAKFRKLKEFKEKTRSCSFRIEPEVLDKFPK